MLHKLKIPSYLFNDVVYAWKALSFEVRENDQEFKAGNIVELHELDTDLLLTGRIHKAMIGHYVCRFEHPEKWVVFTLKEI